MYKDIGKKIEGLATTIGVIGAFVGIGVFIAVWLIMKEAGSSTAGFFVGLIVGGVVFFNAWVSTWLLHGFGSIVVNSGEQVKLLEKQNGILCEALGVNEPKIKSYDLYIEKDSDAVKADDAPYWCQECGHAGPFGRFCPKCGSTVKIYERKEEGLVEKAEVVISKEIETAITSLDIEKEAKKEKKPKDCSAITAEVG